MFASILLTLILLEVALGYIYFFMHQNESSAIYRVIKNRILREMPVFDSWLGNPDTQEVHTIDQRENPFVTYRSVGQYKFHPFIGYTGVFASNEEWDEQDYFGFRNKMDLYFSDKRDYTLVVFSGGSEAAGYTHEATIAENLEKILNQKGKGQFKVLNLAMNSYSISNEINAYVSLAYHQKPEVIIAHTAYNDIFEGMMVPPKFKKLGLNYYRSLEFWLPRLYYLKEYPEKMGKVFNEAGTDLIVDAFWKNAEKYKNIVNSQDGTFILGIQGFNPEIKGVNKVYNMIPTLYQELIDKAKGKGYVVDFTKNETIKFQDSVHTSNESSKIIANIYAELILKQSNTFKPVGLPLEN